MKAKIYTACCVSLIITAYTAHTQTNIFPSTGAAGIGTTSPNISSLLEVRSTTKGILLPRMTQTQRNAIASPSIGLLIYQTDKTPGFYYYSGTAWTAISTKGANTTLSNLKSPTAINADLLPATDGSINLGSPVNAWNNIYFSGSQFTRGIRVLSIDNLNAFIGENAGIANTTGDNNTATGAYALYNNTTGTLNTAIGFDALFVNNESYNTAVGVDALSNTTASQYNTAIGVDAGQVRDNGYNNTFVGAFADVNQSGYYNDVSIGKSALCTAPSQARIGNTFTTSIGGYTDWSNISDGRVKKNIKQNVPGLAFINKLQPITYTLDLDAADKINQRPEVKDKDGKIIQPTQDEINSKKIKEQIVYTGFIAQDVEIAAKNLNFDFSGVDAAKNEHDLYGLRYAEFVVPLVKAVQELSKQNDEQKKINNDLQKQIDELKKIIANNQSSTTVQNAEIRSAATLCQNIPNPFSNATTINYYLPKNNGNAFINFYTQNGSVVKSVKLTANGKGTVNLQASELSSGVYRYALLIDGKIVDSKQMQYTK